jgi:hypothetical protein
VLGLLDSNAVLCCAERAGRCVVDMRVRPTVRAVSCCLATAVTAVVRLLYC